MSYLQLILLLIPALVSGVSFNLAHQRVRNRFYLTCNVENGSVNPKHVQYWINDTERIDILSKAERVSWRYNIIAFELDPQHEGTFYCGETNGEHSDGLGPFAAWPTNSISRNYSHSIYHYGRNVTFNCPVTLGALSQAYSISWRVGREISFPKQYKITAIHNEEPSLTVLNVQPSNIGIYICNVDVTSPYDHKIWRRSTVFKIEYVHRKSMLSSKTVRLLIIGLVMCPCAILSAICQCVLYNTFSCTCKKSKINRISPSKENSTEYEDLTIHKMETVHLVLYLKELTRVDHVPQSS